MKEAIYAYFLAEKLEAFWILVVGISSVLISIYFFLKGFEFFKFFSIPFFLLAVLELLVGGTVYFRTDSQIKNLISTYETSKKDFVKFESERMEVVMKSFRTYKIIEILFILSSFLILIYSINNQKIWISGFAVGLGIQSVFFLVIDFFAEPRGAIYFEAVQNLSKEFPI